MAPLPGVARTSVPPQPSARGRHAAEGHREASDWLAGLRGTTKRRAEEALGTAGSLAGLPGLMQAMVSGQLSGEQASLISPGRPRLPRPPQVLGRPR